MPTTFSSMARAGGEPLTQFVSGAVAAPSGPSVSMFPSQRSCQVTPSPAARAALARSIRRGKSMSQRCGGV